MHNKIQQAVGQSFLCSDRVEGADEQGGSRIKAEHTTTFSREECLS